jgi:hypothetical protein
MPTARSSGYPRGEAPLVIDGETCLLSVAGLGPPKSRGAPARTFDHIEIIFLTTPCATTGSASSLAHMCRSA